MTLLQITAIEVTTNGDRCCRGLVQRVLVGRSTRPTPVRELAETPSLNHETFYAIIDGQFTDLAIGHCSTCRAPHLTTDASNPANNALLSGLPRLDQAAPPQNSKHADIPRRRWAKRRST